MGDNILINLKPIGWVRSTRKDLSDDFWGETTSTIEIDKAAFPVEVTRGLEQFSHVEVIYHFHLVAEDSIVTSAGHPRENSNWPSVGIFAQRKKNRPNRLGLSTCRLVKVDGLTLTVAELDAVDGTPILDIKPYVLEFSPERSAVRQPAWISELMGNYFAKRD